MSNSRIGEDVYSDAFERRQRSVIDKIVCAGFTVVDVGANFGFYTCMLAKRVGVNGRVIAIEPTPKMYEALLYNISVNNINAIAEVRNVALSDVSGFADLYVFSSGNEAYNSVVAEDTWINEPPSSIISVPTLTLDDILSEIPSSTNFFIKIDVEGFQHEVVSGGVESLKRFTNASLMIELSEITSKQSQSSIKDTVQLLGSCGYSPFRVISESTLAPLLMNDFEEKTLNEDVFFFKGLPPSKLLIEV